MTYFKNSIGIIVGFLQYSSAVECLPTMPGVLDSIPSNIINQAFEVAAVFQNSSKNITEELRRSGTEGGLLQMSRATIC